MFGAVMGVVAGAWASPGAVVDVSVGASRWSAVDEDGGVWISLDEGGSWSLTLAPPAGADRVRGELEARAAELGAIDAESDGELDERSVVASDPWLHLDLAQGVRPTVRHAAGGGLVVTRADGLWHEQRDGAWVRALAGPTTAACERPDGRWVVGSPQGVRTGAIGGPWSARDVGPGAVRDVDCGGDIAVAGATGLWIGDGDGWARLPGPDGATAVAGGGRWFAAAGRLWVSSSTRAAPVAVLRLPNTTALVEENATWYATSASGVMASTDQGATWVRADLPAGAVDLAGAGDGRLLLATDVGPVVHVDRGPRAPSGPQSPSAGPLGHVRPDDPVPDRLRGVRIARWMPALDVVGTGRIDVVTPASGPGARTGWWIVGAALTFVPPDSAPDPDVVVVDGEAQLDPGVDTVLAAEVTREATARRTRRVQAVLELQAARRAVNDQLLAGGTVFDRATATLRLAELDARLEALVRSGATP